MDNYSVKRLGFLPIFVVSSLLFIGVGLTTNTHATPMQVQPTSSANNHLQLAYFHVYNRPGRYWGPGYYHRHGGAYWTGWRPYYYRHGVRCQKSCAIDRWSGAIIRCSKRCF